MDLLSSDMICSEKFKDLVLQLNYDLLGEFQGPLVPRLNYDSGKLMDLLSSG